MLALWQRAGIARPWLDLRATPQTAPTLLIHAEADPLTPYAGALSYQHRLHELGVRCTLITEPTAAHRLPDRTAYYQRVLPIYERFFHETLALPAATLPRGPRARD